MRAVIAVGFLLCEFVVVKLEMRFEGRYLVRGICDKNVEVSPVGSAVESPVGILYTFLAEDHLALSCAMKGGRDPGNASESLGLFDAVANISDPIGLSGVIRYGRIILASGVGDGFEAFCAKGPGATGVIDIAWLGRGTSLARREADEWE